METKVLEVSGLRTHFFTRNGVVKAVDGVSFEVSRGETLGLVGESGCGKSGASLSIMRLIQEPRGRIVEGSIRFRRRDGRIVDITKLQPRGDEMRSIRGNEIAMIFQEPMTSLTPVYTVGAQICESLVLHKGLTKSQARERAIELLNLVGIPLPERRVDSYPHELSGGMRQRVMIAMAIACDPSLLIADEPTTALDVTIEAQILELLSQLQERLGMSTILITHDLGVIGEMADRVAVMYTGKIVETGTTYDIFYDPRHPYTQGLLNSRPRIGRKNKLVPIRGTVPSMLNLPRGCYFAPRCPFAQDICRIKQPEETQVAPGHKVSCWLYGEGGAAK